MHWLSFLIGALVGWLICWLIDYLICRRRRMAAEALLNAKLEQCNTECAALRAQLTGHKDLRAQLDGANTEIGTLKAQLADMKDLQARLDAANTEIDALKAQIAGMKDVQADLVAWKAQAAQQRLEIERLNAEVAAGVSAGTAAAAGVVAAADVAPDAGSLETGEGAFPVPAAETETALTAAAAQPGEPDDLTVIEGIGPKINELLQQNGLYTFAQLAATTVERLQSILSLGGPRFGLADPQSWPEQASFARDGKWDALQALQETLKGGRVV